MSSVVDIAGRLARTAPAHQLRHPAGPVLPLRAAAEFGVLLPEIRAAVESGQYCRRETECLARALRPGDRVLEIGAGLGITSAFAMTTGLPARVVALEADPRLVPLARRLLSASGAGGVELVHGAPAIDRRGPAPIFLRRDPRRTSRRPCDGPWVAVASAPFLSIDLILSEARISLLACDLPAGGEALVAAANLSGVDRIMMTHSRGSRGRAFEALLACRGFGIDAGLSAGGVAFYRRREPRRRAA